MFDFEKNQRVWVKMPPTGGVDNYCWVEGRVIKTTAKRVLVEYTTGKTHITYQAPHNVCPFEIDPLSSTR